MNSTSDRLSELMLVFNGLAEHYRELAALAQRKVTLIGKADLASLSAVVTREEAVIPMLQRLEGLRRQLLEWIGRSYGMSPQASRRMSASQLLQRVEPSRRAELERVVQELRRAASDLSEANRIAGLVSAQVLTHLREIFTAISRLDEPHAVYAPSGRRLASASRTLFETTG